MPRISVNMPAYNAGQYIVPAIESILSQTFADFEFLIHDDGSSDDTLAIAKRYAEQDPRVILTTSENRGEVATRNYLLERSSGEFIAVLDADDIALPERFQCQIDFLENHPDHVLIGGQCEWMAESGLLIGQVNCPIDHEELDAKHLQGSSGISHSAVMMRSDAVKRVGGYDINYSDGASDYELWLRMAEIGKLANLPEIVLHYRISSTSMSALKSKQQAINAWQARKSARLRRGINPDVENSPPVHNPHSMHQKSLQTTLQFGWIAWASGRRAAWRHYAFRGLCEGPLKAAAWRLFLVGALKRP